MIKRMIYLTITIATTTFFMSCDMKNNRQNKYKTPSNYQSTNDYSKDLGDKNTQSINNSGYYIVSIDNANVMVLPSTESDILGQLSKGQQIYVSNFIDDWAVVNVQLSDYSTQIAYIRSYYLTKDIQINNYSYGQQYGSSSNTYDYSISGYGDDGYVYGDVSVDKNGGSGYICDDDGNEKYIDVEWTGKGELDGYDEDGNYYELETDDDYDYYDE
jgi:hypothetical protein